MALTRAQLLSGDGSQQFVLPGQVQGVTAGTGVTISPTGALSINTADPTFNAFIRTNAVGAFNSYIWPAGTGTIGQQLTLGAGNALVWSDSDGIPWTALGQLIVGTGVGTDVLLNAGADTAVLMADSTTASGLIYSDSSTGAMLVPVGDTAQQPATPAVGQIRYNTDLNQFEGYLGAVPAWAPIGGSLNPATLAEAAAGTLTTVYSSPETAVPKDASGMTGAAILPSGTTAQQPGALTAGMTRFNTSTGDLEYTDGTDWFGATPKVEGSGATYDEGASVLPVGTTAQRPAVPADGMIRFNADNAAYEAYGQNSTAWEALMPTGASTDKIFYLNEQTVTTDYSLPAAPTIKNGLSAGPITISAGVTVTVPAGQAWSIV